MTFTLVEIALFVLIFLPVFGAPLRHYPMPSSGHLSSGMLIMMGLFILNIGLFIMAAIRPNEGIFYRYPFTLRIIK
jgi:uncharacterized Tic20 family protein